MPLIAQGKTNWKYLLIVIILAAIVGGGTLASLYLWRKKAYTPIPALIIPETATRKEIAPSAIWDCERIEGCLNEWHNCATNLDCAANVMKKYGASPSAINFTAKILADKGYLEQFQDMGKIDLGIVVFPDRANTNEAYYLLNGSPLLVSTEISQEQDMETLANEIKKDPLYLGMKQEYPNAEFWAFAPQFMREEFLPDGNERFVFEYGFINSCRACETEYSGQVGFDFDATGKFLGPKFLIIIKEKIGG